MLTCRERVSRVLRGCFPDRVPFNFWMDRDAMERYDHDLGGNFRVSYYGADVIEAFPDTPWWSELSSKNAFHRDGKTTWQLEPLLSSIADAMKLLLPDPTEGKIYEPIQDVRRRYPEHAIFAMLPTPLEVILPLRLFQGFFLDIYDHPKIVKDLLRRVAEVEAEMARRICDLDIDVLYLAGDICGLNGPLMSEKHLKEFGFDYLPEIINVAKRANKAVFFHTDGRVMDILDLFVEYGVDGINPLQPHLNDLVEFKARWGDRLILYGGLDNCYVIPNGSPKDVRAHVREVFDVVGRKGGLILSSHDIPGYTPRVNIEAMVGAIYGCRYSVF